MDIIPYYLPTSLIFIGYSIATLVYIIRRKELKGIIINELLVAFLFLVTGILFPFMYAYHSPAMTEHTLQLLWFFTSILFIVEVLILFGILLTNAVQSKRDPSLLEERTYEKFRDHFIFDWSDDLRSEFGRKILHLFTCSIIFVFWSLGTILDGLGLLSSLSLDVYSFSFWWIVNIGLGFVIMFHIADLARLNFFYSLPNWAKKWYLSMRKEELDTFLASTPLVLSFVPFVFVPFPIFAAVALITTVADAMACVIGKKFGRHHYRSNPKKTIEGSIAGGLTCFGIVIIVMQLYDAWIALNVFQLFLMAIASTLIFLVVDIYVKKISDNILNPILSGVVMWLIYLL
jgi:dolichol kinase